MNSLSDYWIGNLMRNSVATIWQSPEREEVIRQVNKDQLRACPVFCKPHRMNTVAHRIRELCTDSGNRESVWEWLSDLNELHKRPDDEFFRKPKTVAF